MSIEWTELELNELFNLSSGKSITPGGDGPYPAFGSNGLIGRSAETLFDAGIIIGRVGAYCGSIAISTSPFWASDNTIVALPKEGIDLRFAYFLLIHARLNRHAGGSAQPLLTQATLKPLRFAVPSLPTQRRIASILGDYDDLIEVNRQRIVLLEEMALRLFEEWFIRFRFPGYENHAMVETADGPLPKGWEWRPLKAVCVQPNGIQTGPFGSQLHQSDYVEHGVPVVMPKNIIGLRVVESDIAYVSETKADELGRHRMAVGDVVYGRRGEIGRRAYISLRENGWFCGTGCLRLRPDLRAIRSRFFFDALGLRATLGAIRARAQGATMPNLSAGAMADVPVMVPPYVLQERYEQFAAPVAEHVANLQNANVSLGASRDHLLSRLISGELSVSFAERGLEAVA